MTWTQFVQSMRKGVSDRISTVGRRHTNSSTQHNTANVCTAMNHSTDGSNDRKVQDKDIETWSAYSIDVS